MFEQLENYKSNNDNTSIKDLHCHEMALHEYSTKQDQHNPRVI